MDKCSELERHQEFKGDIKKQQMLHQAGHRCATCAFLNLHGGAHSWNGCEAHYTTITQPREQVCESYYSKIAMNRTKRIAEVLA